jgi:hypothetical protein
VESLDAVREFAGEYEVAVISPEARKPSQAR